jgi:hypothetical protein
MVEFGKRKLRRQAAAGLMQKQGCVWPMTERAVVVAV